MKKSLLLLFSPIVFAGALGAQTIHFSEDFEGGSLPAGWTATQGWAVPGVTSSSFTPPAHTIYAGVNDDASQTANNGNADLITPVINLSSATTVLIKFDQYFFNATYQSITETANLQYSIDGGTTWSTYGSLTGAAGWTTTVIDLTSQLAGQSNVKVKWHYNDGGGWLYGCMIDNVSLFTPPAIDATLTSIDPANGSPAAYGAVSSNITLGGTFQNTGSNAITSLPIKYSDGTNTYTYNLTSINVASFASYTFTHSVPYTIPSTGPHPITMWVDLASDADHSNDTMSTVINGALFMPVHTVTVEEATGTWCGWCVRGIVYMDSLEEVHAGSTNLIAVHNGDPMVVTAYDAGIGTLIGGYPSTVVNGDYVSDPSDLFTDYNNTIGDFGFADITPTVTFNWTTRVATVNASAHFAVDLSGDYRLACVFTEDDVHGSGSTWDQHNYYSSTSQNIPLWQDGVNYQNLPSSIPSAQMYYDYVARTIQGGFNGQTGSLPATITAGSTQTYTFTYTVPAAYNPSKMHVIVMLIDNNGVRHVLNASKGSTDLGATGISNNTVSFGAVNVYPNPSNTTTNVAINLINNENVMVEMYSMTGELIRSENQGELTAGEHLVSFDASTLANGIYFVKVTAGASTVTQKVVVSH